MWLERFSGQSSPSTPTSTPGRSSPAPRRSVQLGPSTLPRRPGLTPRTSSLSASSLSASLESLPATARTINGSGLKEQLSASPSSGVTDPLAVLNQILGPLHNDEAGDRPNGHHSRPESFRADVDFAGLSLEEYAGRRPESGSAHTSAGQGVDDFEKEKERFAELHKSILACDDVLKSVEVYLTSFQADLAHVSNEIESLQNRSTALNDKLENRKAVEKLLGPEAEILAIPPAIVRKITEGTVDDAWIKALEEVEKRSKALKTRAEEGRDTKAIQDLRPLVDDLSAKAIERIRDFVVAQIKALRSPSINAQVIQQNSFLRCRGVFAFMAKREPQLAEEISRAYVNTMRWYYLSHFTRYKTALEKLKLHTSDQGDAIAADSGTTRTSKGGGHDVFTIGRRIDILRTSNDAALPSFAAEDDKGTHYLEVPFRAFNLALIDNASAEFSFLTEFFYEQPFQAVNRRFNEILQSSFDLGLALTKELTEHTLDALGVLTCVRLNQHFAFELQRRKIPAGEGYINGTNMLLWPRFQIIVDAHCDSIRKATASLTGKPVGSALSLTTPAASARTTAPHPLTQRYANFLQGILALSSEAGDDEPVANSTSRMRNDFEAFLTKLSKGIAETRKRERFLYNNYSLICTIIAETEGKLADDLKGYYLERREAFGTDI